MGVVLRDRLAEDQKERREQHETEADAQGRPEEKAVMPSVGRAEKREELDDRRVDSHSRKLGVHHRHADQNIGQPDLLLAQKVRKQQNFVDVPDDDTQIGENRDRDAVALDDAHLLAFYGFNSLAAGFAERAADGDSALFCGITVFSAVSRGRCRCILAAVVSMPFRFWRCLPALHGNIPACGKRGRIPSVRFPCGMGRIPGLRTRRTRPFLRRNSYPKGTFRNRLRIRSEILRPPVEGCGYFKGNTGGGVCGRPPCRPRRLHPFRYVDPRAGPLPRR